MVENNKQTKGYMTSQTTTEIVDGKEVYRRIPTPIIPSFPIMSLASIFPLSSPKIPSLFQNTNLQYFIAGRYAIYQALKDMDAQEKDEILVPAYHCKAMIYPILDAGCIPIFYKINDDFTVNITDLENLISNRCKAVMAVNYFGFVQNILDVRKTCDRYGLKLIEDCAHSLFGSSDNNPVGQTGDYAIASTKKFFSVELGGILTRKNSRYQKTCPAKYNIFSEIRFVYNTIEKSVKFNRMWIFKPAIFLIGKLRGNNEQNKIPALTEVSNSSDDPHEEYSLTDRLIQPTKLSIFLEKYVSHHRIFVKRRENYNYLVNALKNVQNITIPITEIPDGIVPYMLPIIIKNLENIFPDIEDKAIPFQRFGQFLWQGSERCPVSQKYSQTILQLPCHQELSSVELQWIVDMLCEILDLENTNDC